MKVRASVKPICDKCKIIKRKGSIRVICENPKLDDSPSKVFVYQLTQVALYSQCEVPSI